MANSAGRQAELEAGWGSLSVFVSFAGVFKRSSAAVRLGGDEHPAPSGKSRRRCPPDGFGQTSGWVRALSSGVELGRDTAPGGWIAEAFGAHGHAGGAFGQEIRRAAARGDAPHGD